MPVTIGIDPHKSTHTAVAVDRDEQQIARFTLPANKDQTDRLLAWAEPLDADRVWAIESAAGLGRLLAQQLIAAGERVVDVPPTLTARVRLLGSSKASKNDPNDAYATAIAGLRHCGLRTVTRDGHTAILRLLADRHHDLVGLRTQSACRLHVMLRELSAGGAPIRISAAHGSEFVDRIDVGDDLVAQERKRLAREHLADMRRLDGDLDAVKLRIRDAVAASATTLTELHGVGPVVAAVVLGHVHDITRFRTRAQFASYNGTAPIEASSSTRERHRLNPRGNRQLNHAIHMIAVTQVGHDTPGRAYYLRRQAEGKTRKEALRALKRRISDAVWRQLQIDSRNQK
jgi:transposase